MKTYSRGIPVAIAAAVLALPAVLQAQVIPIPNGNFESPDANVFPYANPAITTWQKVAPPAWWTLSGFSAADWEQTAGVFYNVPSVPTFIDNMSSSQAAFVFATPEVQLFQVLPGNTYEVGKAYHLAFGAIGGGGFAGNVMQDGAPIGISLYYLDAGNNQVPIATTTVIYDIDNDPTNGRTHFPSYSVDIPVVGAGDAWAGKNIGIRILSLTDFTNGGGYWDVGNLELSATVPEPASLAVLACGLAGLTLRRRNPR